MKLELTAEDLDVIKDALSMYCNDIYHDMITYSNEPKYVDFYTKAIKTFSNVQKQLPEQDK